MVSVKHSSAFSYEVSPEHSDFEDDVGAPGDANLRNPLSSASRPGPDDVTSLLHQMQLESERSRQREQALLQRLAAAEQRLPTSSASRSSVVSTSARVVHSSVPGPATAPLTSAGSSDPDVPATGRNPSPFLAQIPDSDPGKKYYDLCGRKMSMLAALFPVPEDFTRPLPDFDPTSETRFATPENRARGHTADIYAIFPPACHAGLRNSTRVQQAIIGLAGARRHLATHCIPGSFHDIFAELPEGLRNAIRVKDWTYPKAAFMVQGNSKSWTKLQLCPAYYPDGRSDEAKEVFRAPWLIRLARRILYSSTSLQSATQREPPKKTDGKRWNADVTAGLIAMCCVLTRFALGPDKSFTNVGDESEFDFAAAYLYLKEFILKALALRHKWAIALLLFWRTHVLAPSVLAQVLGDDLPESFDSAALAEEEEHLRLLEQDFDGDFENYADGSDGYESSALGYGPLSPLSTPAAGSTATHLFAPMHTPQQDPVSSHVVPSVPTQLAPAILFATNSSTLRPFMTPPVVPNDAAELEVLVGGVRRTIRAPPGLGENIATPAPAAQSSLLNTSEDPEHGLVAQTVVRNGELLRIFPRIGTLPCDQPERYLDPIGASQDATDWSAAPFPDLAIRDEFSDADDMPALLPAEAPAPAVQVRPRPRQRHVPVAHTVEVIGDQGLTPAEETVDENAGKTTKRRSTRTKKA